jgi:hypothetical protein
MPKLICCVQQLIAEKILDLYLAQRYGTPVSVKSFSGLNSHEPLLPCTLAQFQPQSRE